MAGRLEFDEAIISAQIRLKVQDTELKQGMVEMVQVKTTRGVVERPWGEEGGFAIVYRFRTRSGHLHALRCFKAKLNPDTQFRYERLGLYFRTHAADITARFTYYDTGILVKERFKEQVQNKNYSILVMEWIEGVTLLDKVDELCKKRDLAALGKLADQWLAILRTMSNAHMAHGSLAGNNVMVRTDGRMVLIDYDGMYIPDFSTIPSAIAGQPDYHHPQFRDCKYDEWMDAFSALVIYTALLIAQAQPELWLKYVKRDLLDAHMIFKHDDFKDHSRPLWTDLNRISDARVSVMLQALKQACKLHANQVRFPFHLVDADYKQIDISNKLMLNKVDTKPEQTKLPAGNPRDVNESNLSVYGPVQGLVYGEFNTVTLNFYGNRDHIIPFLAPPRSSYRLRGREKLISELKQQLFGGGDLALSALNGLPGVGKTALALALAHDPDILKYYNDGILWAGLGREPNILSHLGSWGQALGLSPSNMAKITSTTTPVQTIQESIHQAIGTRRMLLIVDDAWSADAALAFKLGGPYCAHLVTTRIPEIAEIFAGGGAIIVRELDEDNGIELLEQFAPGIIETALNEARELVRAVGGLPLPLMLIGRHLRVQMHSGQPRRLRAALDDLLHQIEQRLALSQPQAGLERHPSLPEDVPLSLLTVIKISDEALSEDAKKALRALSVFPSKPNTFSDEAAQAVASTSPQAIDSLVDFGLLEASSSGRYMLHQAISDYAKTVFTDETAYERMIDFFSYLVEANQTNYRLLDMEASNILSAVEILLEKEIKRANSRAFAHFIRVFLKTRMI